MNWDALGVDLERHGELIFWISTISLISLVLGAFAGPWLISRLPSDYFLRTRPAPVWKTGVWKWPLAIGRNLLGAFLILMGVLMLVLPGQGILTIVAGFIALDFPSKRRLLRWLTKRAGIRKALNWVRKRFSRPPFVWEDAPRTAADSRTNRV